MSMPGNFPIFAVEFFALRLRKTLSYRDFFVKENIYTSIWKIVGILHTFSISKSIILLIIIEYLLYFVKDKST